MTSQSVKGLSSKEDYFLGGVKVPLEVTLLSPPVPRYEQCDIL